MPQVEDDFLGVLDDLLRAAQKAGTVRADIAVPDIKAIVVGAQAVQAVKPDAAERLTEVALDG